MRKVQMHVGAISKLLFGFASVRAIIHSLKLMEGFWIISPYRRTNHTITYTLIGLIFPIYNLVLISFKLSCIMTLKPLKFPLIYAVC